MKKHANQAVMRRGWQFRRSSRGLEIKKALSPFRHY
jgi:hypothetical protein